MKSGTTKDTADKLVKADKKSGITNDANDYANETIGDPRYPLDLFRRVITVSIETMKIVNGLPELELPDQKALKP